MMEIDTVCEETTLWFEFLLKPELLEKQMTNQTKALEIMSEFLNIIPPDDIISSPDTLSLTNKFGRKQLAIKILALKIASGINWNLDVIEKNLPISKQVQLLSDLCSITSGRLVNIPLSLVHEVPVTSDGSKSALSFALTIYHRWLLRAQVLKGSNIKIKPFAAIMNNQEPSICAISDDKFISGLESFTTTSIDFLNQILADSEPFKMLIFESFVPLEESSRVNRNDAFNGNAFDKYIIISKTELKAQIYYDLCSYYIFTKKYKLAKEMAILCRDNYKKLTIDFQREELKFCTVTDENLKGYLLACGILQEGNPSLFQRFNECLLNDRKQLECILSEDNYKKEIPFIHRKTLEGDIESSSNEFIKVLALNSIRYILDSSNIITSDIPYLALKNNTQRNLLLKYFVQYSNEIHGNLQLSDQTKMKKYLTNFLIRHHLIEMELKDSKFFTSDEIDLLKRQKTIDTRLDLSSIGLQTDWISCDSKIQRIRFAEFERKLVASTTSKQVRKYLVELAKFNPQQSLWMINRNWYLPNDLRVVVLNLKIKFLQDFSYILLGKVNEMVLKKDFVSAYALITELKNEAKRAEWSNDQTVMKLGKLLEWEKIYIQILMRLDSAWPKKPPTLREQWTVKFIQMIKTVSNDMPRLDIIENCLIMLINLNDWENCLIIDSKRSPICELCVSFAKTMLDIQTEIKNNKPSIPIPRKRDIWDLLLPIFNMSNQQQTSLKRNQHDRRSSDSPGRFLMVSINLSTLKQFLDKIRDQYVISILLSMFAKMHNLIKDDTSMDLYIDNLHLWPLSISNVNGYNVKSISESLLQLLKLGTRMYTTNASWIRLQGDLEYVNGNNEAAMKFFVQSLILTTEFSYAFQRTTIDDSIVKKMIKCCSNLGCFLQAVVLCQFMEDVDYTLAFKLLQEKSSGFQDAMDSYYSLIWDTTLLEYIINLHAKKGEHKRRLQAISYIRQLELNANNCEEIKQKAAIVRKSKFLRSLANQYL